MKLNYLRDIDVIIDTYNTDIVDIYVWGKTNGDLNIHIAVYSQYPVVVAYRKQYI